MTLLRVKIGSKCQKQALSAVKIQQCSPLWIRRALKAAHWAQTHQCCTTKPTLTSFSTWKDGQMYIAHIKTTSTEILIPRNCRNWFNALLLRWAYCDYFRQDSGFSLRHITVWSGYNNYFTLKLSIHRLLKTISETGTKTCKFSLAKCTQHLLVPLSNKGKHSSQLFCLFQSFCSFIENGEKLQLLLIIGTRWRFGWISIIN